MESYLKHYKAKITVKSPIFIGDGTKIGKKEFIYSGGKKQVLVPDMEKLFTYLRRKYLDNDYISYMLESGNRDLGRWLTEHRITEKEYGGLIRYTLDAGDALVDTGGIRNRYGTGRQEAKAKEILCFIKDAQGCPYVPGSSIKGMIRTALLAYEVMQNASLRGEFRKRIAAKASEGSRNRNQFLRYETQDLETRVFHTVERDSRPKKNAVCSNMAGLIIGDSAPLATDRLTLCQKIDYSIEREEKRLPLLREALKPGTEILFDITIDPTICPYTIEQILAALDAWQLNLYEGFYSRFGRGCGDHGTVWLGGGCGFPTRTVIAALCEKDTTRITAEILRSSIGRQYTMHKHDRDVTGYGISPHVCKCTRYKGELYDMGRGRIEIIG